MAIVMGLDQHRAQITAEWIDTETGEVSRARVAPAHRESVRRFLGRFDGGELEVALEATTGWRFVVEELRRVRARVHLAEPAETSALRGNKKRAKNDRADARHLRELLMAGRLPESWIPPDHLLDLRARVRLRHALVHERGEWQQRMQAVLYHHGLPKRADLLTRENRAWVEQLPLPVAGREQIAVGLHVIDAVDVRLAPIDKQLWSYARRQAGCRALKAAHYGIGALTSVTILAELGDARAGSHPRARRSATAGWTSPCTRPISAVPQGTSPAKGPPALRWALYEAAQAARRPGSPDRDYYQQAAERLGGNRACLALARKLLKRSYHTLRSLGEDATRARMTLRRVRNASSSRRCTAASSRHSAAATLAWTASKDRATASPSPAGTPSPSCRRPGSQPETVDRDKHGRPRAHTPIAPARRLSSATRSALAGPPMGGGDRHRRAGARTQRWSKGRAHPDHLEQLTPKRA